MIETTTVLALVVMGLVWLGSGVVLGWAEQFGGPPVAATALTVAGLGTLVGVVVDRSGHPVAAGHVLVVAWAVALPLAVVSYPRWSWRNPVDFLTLATVGWMAAPAAAHPGRRPGVAATALIGAMYVSFYLQQIPRSPRHAVPGTIIAAAVLANIASRTGAGRAS